MFTSVVIKSAVIRLPMINLSPLIFKPKHSSAQVHYNNNTNVIIVTKIIIIIIITRNSQEARNAPQVPIVYKKQDL